MAYSQSPKSPLAKALKGNQHKLPDHLKDAIEGESDSPVKRTKAYTAGMSAAERKAYNKKTGGNLKRPQPEGGSRRDSYCARSAGIKKCKDPDKNGDCPNDIARRNWKC
jgi:hypothetical protein